MKLVHVALLGLASLTGLYLANYATEDTSPKPASPEITAWAEKCLVSSCAGDFVTYEGSYPRFVTSGERHMPGSYPMELLRGDIEHLKGVNRLGEIKRAVSFDGNSAAYMASVREYTGRK